uniref:FAD binding domain-containing protein n=1 Tax=Volvariella volvacea TaxID=36659 RepID=I6UEV8_9AGAR|nr:FAD binding domain-containing protein [Volvariella volvacea]
MSTYAFPVETLYENKSLPNSMGVNPIPSYPDLLNGTNCANPAVPNYNPPNEVDVFILGAGPVGLMVAASLTRQGISLRIVDRSPHPLVCGRADSLQPRTMEVFHSLGLSEEVFSLGNRIEHTVVYKDGKKEIFAESHQTPPKEGRFQGLNNATQTEVEHVLIRDLVRHDILVERPCTATSYHFDENAGPEVTHPITINLINQETGKEEVVKARYLVASDGAHSMIRKSLPIQFNGIKTDLHWGIVDAVIDTDFPHRWTFGTVINSEHGGCLIIPRERDMVRLYAQLKPEPGQEFDPSKWGPEEVLEQLNKIYAPYTMRYASPVDWFAVLTINERVASSFTYKDRIFLAGDSCHVHSAKGAFGLNTGTMDAHNLAWKLGLLVKGVAQPSLLNTYDVERRENALRAVATSARYLRFVSNCSFSSIDGTDNEMSLEEAHIEVAEGEDPHVAFFKQFVKDNGRFLIGLDVDYRNNAINVPVHPSIKNIRAGYRAPDPRVSLSRDNSSRLYNSFGRVDQFNLVVFGSNLRNPAIVPKLKQLDSYFASPNSFYQKYAPADLWKVVVVARDTPSAAEKDIKNYPWLAANAQLVFDDQLPLGIFGGDAHVIYGVDHNEGALVVVRPDTWIGTGVPLTEAASLESYFDSFLTTKA